MYPVEIFVGEKNAVFEITQDLPENFLSYFKRS